MQKHPDPGLHLARLPPPGLKLPVRPGARAPPSPPPRPPRLQHLLGGAEGSGRLRRKRGGSGTCALARRGWIKDGGTPSPSSPSLRGSGREAEKRWGGSPPGVGAAPGPLLPAAPVAGRGKGRLASGAEVTFSTAPAASRRFPGFSQRRQEARRVARVGRGGFASGMSPLTGIAWGGGVRKPP